MKLLRTPAHRQLLEQLIAARHRANFTLGELADKVTAGPDFAEKYASGEHGCIVRKNTLSSPWGWRREG